MSRVLACLVLLEAVAIAQPAPDPTVQARQLFDDGRALAKDGKWAAACDAFTKSFVLDPAIGTELNLGDCHEHLGHLALGWRMFDDAAKKDTDADRRKYAQGRADALGGKLATVVIKVPDARAAGLVLKVGGQAVPPAAEVHTMAEPGSVAVELDVPGQAPAMRTQPAKPGETVTVDFAPVQIAPGPTDVTADHPGSVVSVEQRQRSRVHLAEGLGAGGLVLFGTSAAIALVAKSHYDAVVGPGKACDSQAHCTTTAARDKANDAVHLASSATYVGLAGVALVVAAGVVWWTAPKEFVVAPAVTGKSAGITLSRTF